MKGRRRSTKAEHRRPISVAVGGISSSHTSKTATKAPCLRVRSNEGQTHIQARSMRSSCQNMFSAGLQNQRFGLQNIEVMRQYRPNELSKMIKTGEDMFQEWQIDKLASIKHHLHVPKTNLNLWRVPRAREITSKTKVCAHMVTEWSSVISSWIPKNALSTKIKFHSIRYGKIKRWWKTANFQT